MFLEDRGVESQMIEKIGSLPGSSAMVSAKESIINIHTNHQRMGARNEKKSTSQRKTAAS